MAILYRQARADDLEPAQALVVASINDLSSRHGFGRIASLRPPLFQAFSLQDDANGLWVAEEDGGRMLGYAFSWVSGRLWFLAELFVAPDQQGRGIGQTLLQRCFTQARQAGATHKALITFAFNTVSQGLYIRHGMLPRLPLHIVRVARNALPAGLPAAPLQAEPLDERDLPLLAEIDAAAQGTTRDKHHRFLLGDTAMIGLKLQADGQVAGYAYASRDGHIGPLAVRQPALLGPALHSAIAATLGHGAPQISALLPGTSDQAFAVAMAHNMRLLFPMMLMASRDFGDWRGYLPRNPGFM
jgi:ribosomal protein S18 acetylase RimI-like enzyme